MSNFINENQFVSSQVVSDSKDPQNFRSDSLLNFTSDSLFGFESGSNVRSIDFTSRASLENVKINDVGITTAEVSQVLLVSVHNMIYPITENELHQVFDPYGYIENIIITSTTSYGLQALIHFHSIHCAIQSKNHLYGRNIYNGCCQLDIQYFRSESKSDSRQKIRFQIAANQILSVSIHHMIYPITEEVLHQVFDPYGYVEKIVIASTKSNEFQALIQFESSMCAAQARTFLQGKYIYDGVCQMDIQYFRWDENPGFKSNTNVADAATAEPKNPCNFRSDSFGTSAEKVESSITTADLNFIRNEILRIIAIIDRIQDRLEAVNSTIQNFTHTMSKSSQATSSISVISPTKSKELLFAQFPAQINSNSSTTRSEKIDDELSVRTALERLEIQLQKQELLNAQFSAQIKFNSDHLNSLIMELPVCENEYKLFDLMLEQNSKKISDKVVFIFDPGGSTFEI